LRVFKDRGGAKATAFWNAKIIMHRVGGESVSLISHVSLARPVDSFRHKKISIGRLLEGMTDREPTLGKNA
jgi:hypothetical protein